MAIVIERTITVKNDKATLDNPLYLYIGDGDITYLFTINEIKKAARFGVIDTVNMIAEGSGYGEVRIYKPDGELVFTTRAEIIDDRLQVLFSYENIDQITESGVHLLQVHLYDDDDEERNRFTIPPIELNVLFPVGTNPDVVGASVGQARVAEVAEEPMNTFNDDGSYNATEWVINDKITAAKLNKIENALYEINDTANNVNVDLSGYATEDYVDNAINQAQLNGSEVDLSDYALKIDVPTKTSQLINNSGYITSIPDEYVTETELANKGYITDISNKADVDHTHEGYLTEVPDEYITETELNNKGYITDISGKADVNHTHEEYLTEHQSLAGLISSNSVVRIEVVSELPATELDGVLYIVIE